MTSNFKPKNLCLSSLIIACCFASTACSEGDKYGKETDSETVIEVVQEPYKFHMFPRHGEHSLTTIELSIERNGAQVGGAKVSGKLVANDGSEIPLEFHENSSTHKFESESALKHHEDYMFNSEITIDGQKLTPIFSFHNDDPKLEKLESKHHQEKH